MERHFGRSSKGLKGYERAVRGVTGSVREQLRAEKELGSARQRQMRDAERSLRREARARQYHHRLRKSQVRDLERAERMAARRRERDAQRFARITSHRATRFFWPNAPIGSMAKRAAFDIGRGIGLDLSGVSALQSAVGDQRAATKLSNAAIISNDPRNANRVAPGQITSEANTVGARYGFNPTQVIEGLNQFTKRTGDLATGREMLEQLTRIAAATGSEIDQLFGTAGELANQLTDVSDEEKPRVILNLLKQFAGQGKLGAVELEDFSRYGARIASTAGLYEGSRASNIATLGALAQASRAFGGADTPAMAATSVARLATTFKTGARAKQFEALTGNSVYGASGKIRNPIELITEAVVATKGKPIDWNKIFMNVMAERAAGGLASRFRDAYDASTGSEAEKTQAGKDAIDAFMSKMRDAALSEEQIADNIAANEKNFTVQVNRLNVKFKELATKFLDKFLPVLERVSPELERFAELIGDVATWALENPKKAIGAAIGASILRAGIETAARTAIEKAIMGGAGEVAGGAAAGLKGALLAKAGLIGLAVAAAIATARYAPEAIKAIDPEMKNHDRDFSWGEVAKDWEDAKLLFSRDKNFFRNAFEPSETADSELFDVQKTHHGYRSDDPSIRAAAVERSNRAAMEQRVGTQQTRDADAINVLRSIDSGIRGLGSQIESSQNGRLSQQGDPR